MLSTSLALLSASVYTEASASAMATNENTKSTHNSSTTESFNTKIIATFRSAQESDCNGLVRIFAAIGHC